MIQTVNVVQYNDASITSLTAFSDTPEGRELAIALFKTAAKAQGFEDADIESGLEEGLVEQGDYQLFLVQSK